MNYEIAYEIASIAHLCQQDKGGTPYIEHPLAVANMMGTEEERIVAILHDTVEDGGITLDYLREKGFNEEIVLAVDSVTRRNDESWNNFIHRVKNNKLGTKVKRKDLKHNMDLSRIPKPKKEDLLRIQKYREAEFFLEN